MKTLIVYASKYGAAAEIARRIADRIKGAVVHDLKKGGVPPLDGFDCVIMGSSVYVGKIRKEAKTFLSKNSDALLKKKLGLFLSAMETSEEKACLEANFPLKILEAAKKAVILGGIWDPKKASAFDRFLLKMAGKKASYISTIDDAKIQQFVDAMNA